jgi:hypothetical protein
MEGWTLTAILRFGLGLGLDLRSDVLRRLELLSCIYVWVQMNE